MRIAILFFTGTGSTAKFAEEIAQGFLDQNHDVSLLRLDKINKPITGYDIVGVGSPTYSFRAPRLATSLLRKLEIEGTPGFFVFCTCGGMEGNTFWNLYKLLKKKNCVCLGKLVGYGPNNLRVWRPNLAVEGPFGDGIGVYYLAMARDFGGLILERYQEIIVLGSKPPIQITQKYHWSLWSIFLTLRWQMAFTVGKKYIDLGMCTKCGLCATKICPSGCISMNHDMVPVFDEKKCVGCSGCVSLCPTLAIWSKKTISKHPYIIYSNNILRR